MPDNISFDTLPYTIAQMSIRLERIEALLSNSPIPGHVGRKKPITTKELCELLNITEPTIIRWRNKGKIPFMRIGGSFRYDIEAVLKALEETKPKRFI